MTFFGHGRVYPGDVQFTKFQALSAVLCFGLIRPKGRVGAAAVPVNER